MESNLNTELLAGMLKQKRGDKGLRTIADEIGTVSAATLSRIEQGKIPDVDTFIRLCKWMGVSTETFITGETKRKTVTSHEQVVAHLRAERALKKETVNMLIQMIDMAYKSK